MLRITFNKKVGTAVTGLGTVIKISSNISAASLVDLLHIREDCATSAAEAGVSEANALASAISASSSATAANDSATAAAGSASSASNSASAALASKNAASTSETNAANSAASALASKNAAALSESSATASKVASKASEDAAKLSELAAYASELSSAASAQDAEASETAAATAEVNSIANATASYNYSELARGYANDAEVSKGESQASAEEAEVHAQEAIVNADAAKVSELAAKASEVASKASEVASKTSETNSKASELAAKDSETIATTKAAQTTADATLTASHVNQTASNVVLAVAAKDAAEAAASTVTGGIIDKGAWDASTGVFPDKPTRPLPEGGTALVSAFWKVTVSGTVEGISFLIGDDLRFSASTDAFYKVDNTDAVASVQGKTGAVTLSASEVGALATPTGTHAVDTVLVAGATAGTSKHSGYTLAKSVPSNALFTDTIYNHPTTDGNLHVPATGTTNNGKVLAAGATAGSIAWKTLVPADVSGLETALLAKLDANANAVSATKLQSAVTINSVAFDGSSNITITAANPTTLTRGAGLTGANYNGASATTWAVAYGTAAGTACQGNDARLSDARTPLAHSHVWADVTGTPTTLAGYGITDAPTKTGSGASGSWGINVTGNAASATTLQTARTLTIGSTGKSFNGSGNVSWSLAEIGAQPAGSYAAASHTHAYLPLTGGTLTGELVMNHQRIIMNPLNGSGSFGVVKHQISSGGESWLTAISDTLANHNAIGISQNEGPKCWINNSMYRIYHQGFKPTPAEIGALPITGGTLSGGLTVNGNFAANHGVFFGTGNDYANGGLEVFGNGAANTVFPNIGFHQPGLYAASLQLRGAADFRFVALGGASYANVTAATFYGALSGNAATATLASTVAVNGSASNAFYDMLWREGNTVFIANAGKAQINPATGDMRLGGHVTFAYASDENLKTGITEIENPLDKVCSLRTATYLKKSILPDEDGEYTYIPETGFIAQDLEKVIPNLISVNDSGYKTINGGGFEIEALLAGAIKELKKQHDEEIAALKEQIAMLMKLV